MNLIEFVEKAKKLKPGEYPTKDLIQKYQITIKKEFLDIVRKWKKQNFDNHWRSDNNQMKTGKLIKLVEEVTKGMEYHYREFWPNKEIEVVTKVDHYCMFFSPNKSKIRIGFDTKNPSIISTLHELGHAFLGFNELKACVFSQAIFTKVFPNQFNKLVWEGHMLKKCQKK